MRTGAERTSACEAKKEGLKVFTDTAIRFRFCGKAPQHLGETMAHVVETAIVHGVEGKSRAQQIARLREWKKHFLSEGVEKVVLSEVGAGNIDGAWILAIHHKSGAAYGGTIDAYFKNPKTFDALMEKWSKTPTIKMASFAVTFEIDDF
jgi:hypothetical protein